MKEEQKMIKPKNFDNTQAFGGYVPLTTGGHILTIMKVEETVSKKTGNPMVNIYVDTAPTDIQPAYFSEQFKNNTKADKKWSNSAIVRQVVVDSTGNTSKGFKTFIEAVKASNNNLTDDKIFGDFPIGNVLKGKFVGGVFARREFLNSYGESKFAVECVGFRSVDDVLEGRIETPKDILLKKDTAQDFMEDVTPVDDGDLPF